MAFHAIKAGEGDTYIAAGVEAVSRAGKGADFQFHPQLDGSENSVYNVYIPMGLTAENVADRCKVSREAQDEWAVISQNRAVDAQESGHFDKEIVACHRAGPHGHRQGGQRGRGARADRHQGRRPAARARRYEKLSQLPPAFKPDGTVTAGNACPLNDGAAALLVMSDERAEGARADSRKSRIIASTVAAIRPEIMGLGPIPAIEKLLAADEA